MTSPSLFLGYSIVSTRRMHPVGCCMIFAFIFCYALLCVVGAERLCLLRDLRILLLRAVGAADTLFTLLLIFFEPFLVALYSIVFCVYYRLVCAVGFVKVFEHFHVEEKLSVLFTAVKGYVLVTLAVQSLSRPFKRTTTDGAV